MANVEHSVLTGSDLHEPKGVAAAAANRVYLSNGSGSGSWTTVPAAAITSAGVLVFQGQKYHIRDEVSSGTASQGSLTSSTWNTRRLQTEKTDDLTITLGSNQFTLAAGTYLATGWCMALVDFFNAGGGTCDWASQIRLRNITDSTTTLVGSHVRVKPDGNTNTDERQFTLTIDGQFVIAGTKTFELQHYVNNITNINSCTAGNPASSGENEVYAELIIWKLS